MHLSRRRFLHHAGAVGMAFTGLARWQDGQRAGGVARTKWQALGPLKPDPQGLLELPAGFQYTAFSNAGDPMDDGLLVPARHDGMAAFAGPGGKTLLVRNHENLPGTRTGAFGDDNVLLKSVDPAKVYDAGNGTNVCLGGTVTLVFDTRTQELERQWLSLAGTVFNCAGGPTPWGSWVSCEENTLVAGTGGVLQQDHGFCFEVPARHEGLVDPVPLVDMGRFKHEAIAVDPRSGVIYLTEDQVDSAFYRFLPVTPGELREGGVLQALVIRGEGTQQTCNWPGFEAIPRGIAMEVSWIDLEDVLSPDDSLRHQAFERGAARFARGEGISFGGEHAYFTCTFGGPARIGQVWRYTPSPAEGTPGEEDDPGRLELFLEPNDAQVMENCDNLTVSPWGHLILCEDGNETDHLLGVTTAGEPFLFARNARSFSEFAGATFSPDGSTLFVNLQEDGVTVAITGDWDRFRSV